MNGVDTGKVSPKLVGCNFCDTLILYHNSSENRYLQGIPKIKGV